MKTNMKTFIFAAALTAFFGFAQGCNSTEDGFVPIKNAQVNAKNYAPALPGPRVYVTRDLAIPDDATSKQCCIYVENAFRQLGFEVVSQKDLSDFIAWYSYKMDKKHDKTTFTVFAKGTKAPKLFWQGKAYCTTSESGPQKTLSGLVAATMPFFKRNENSEIVLKEYPEMVQAVTGSTK